MIGERIDWFAINCFPDDAEKERDDSYDMGGKLIAFVALFSGF